MLKNQKGITLVALVITIVILIILATVTLNVVLGEGGLIDRAQGAKDLTEQAALEEQEELNSLLSEMTNIMSEDQTPPTPTIPETTQEAKPNPNEDGPSFENTKTITDDLDNPVTIPGGFHLDKDSGTKVEEGIVIEDGSGNQFVWIPVGTYNVSTTINASGTLTNNLTRRDWAEANVVLEPTEVEGDNELDNLYYGEGNENSIGKDQIDGFKTSGITNKGFYIGRYEQGQGNVCKASVDPYTGLDINTAKAQAEVMYSGNTYVTSELISSYAWDTALNFICQTNKEGYLLATTQDKAYGNINTGNLTKTGEYKVDGQTADKYSNIYDMIGNRREWTTEFSNINGTITTRAPSGVPGPYVKRGGDYFWNMGYAAYRNSSQANIPGEESDIYSFRVQLYIK